MDHYWTILDQEDQVKLIRVKWCESAVNVPGISASEYDNEDAFQVYCADWLRKQYELTGNEAFDYWHHSANENRGSARAGHSAKMKGQSKGFPDFVHYGLKLAIELKVCGRHATMEQLRWLKYFQRLGWHSEVVYNFERFKELVLNRISDIDIKV